MCVGGDGCVGLPISLCVCVFVCALVLYIFYVEHTMGGVEATMGRRTSRWSP